MLVVNNMAEAADREMEVSKSEGTFEENKSFQERLNEMPVVVNNMSEAADREMEVSKSEGTFEENKSFQERLNEMPAYTMSLSQLQTFYTTLKDRNEVLKNAFDAGEEYMNKFVTVAKPVVWAATASALTVAKPVVGELKDPGKIYFSGGEQEASIHTKRYSIKVMPYGGGIKETCVSTCRIILS